MKKIKLVLLGTPNFAATIFEKLIEDFDVQAIVSQPDRPANRGYKIEPTATKLLAQKHNINVYQPEKIIEIAEILEELKPDFIVSAAFGQYVPLKILNIPLHGSINVHGSLLPKYRGAAPIQHSLINNDTETGISLIYMVKEMDAGDIIATAKINILPEDTAKELFTKLANLAKENISKWIYDLYYQKVKPKMQDHSQATLSPKIDKSFAEIFLTDSCEIALGKIRALNDNPGAFVILDNKRIKIYRASLKLIKNALILELADGKIYCYEYQYESKKRVYVAFK
ncbi:methionyl-tRNA formyltransferase [Mycoplasma iguanae]|uniref:Methionyl-tRNA formyltransferase n=1 Tax=Mycoplasma iguanae TaxID=292461 RepID=A0ABY5R831_9MOLU|nr:methionyl-tRNA formyltransferase [Mycoplasma iguanae]UVD81614.1 methionyl-tRNA formyltransferase [Mycoplasma iguanae]